MQKKILVTLTATATAFSMLVAPCVTAFAEESEPLTKTQNIGSGTSTINQDIVIDDGYPALTVYGENTSVTLNGDIDQQGTHEDKYQGSVQTSSNAAVTVRDGAALTINGDIVAGSTAISAKNNSEVTVNGNINITGVETTHRSYTNDGTLVDEYKTVSSYGFSTDGTSDITINGTIDSAKESILLNPTQSGKGGQITVTGKMTISDESQQGIDIYSPSVANGGYEYSSKEEMLSVLPEITVYEIDSKYPVTVNSASTDKDIVAQVRETVLNTINYIIKKDTESEKAYGLAISGDDIEKHGTGNYDTINVNDSFNVALDKVIPEGYELSGGENVTVTKNENGTFTLKLTNNKGGIYVAVRLIPVTTDDGSTAFIVENEPVISDSDTSNSDSNNDNGAVQTGAIVVANSTASTEAAAASAAISGDKPARMLTFDIAKVTPKQYKESVIANIGSAPSNGALNIVTDRVSCFDTKMLQAIAARPDLDVNVVFTYGGKKFKVTIPAGFDVMTLLDGHGYCGFLRLMSILGSTDL